MSSITPDMLDTVALGDCLKLMPQLPDNSIDMVLCDLPYGRTQNRWDSVIPFEDLWKEYKRIVKPNGAIVLFSDGMFMADLMVSNKKMWKYNLVWDKVLPVGFLNANRMPMRSHEEICVFYQKQCTYNPQKTIGEKSHSKGKMNKDYQNNNYGGYELVDNAESHGNMKFPVSIQVFESQRPSILSELLAGLSDFIWSKLAFLPISIQRSSKPHPSKAKHPTEKPLELCEWLIKTYSNHGDVILDNTIGSGTSGEAAIRTGRHIVGMEQNPEYHQIAMQKIEEAKRFVAGK